MREIVRLSRFKRDYKREKKGKHSKSLDSMLRDAVNALVNNVALPEKLKDHKMSGEWEDHCDCHLKPDLVLIYRKPDKKILQLVRLGSHSELGI